MLAAPRPPTRPGPVPPPPPPPLKFSAFSRQEPQDRACPTPLVPDSHQVRPLSDGGGCEIGAWARGRAGKGLEEGLVERTEPPPAGADGKGGGDGRGAWLEGEHVVPLVRGPPAFPPLADGAQHFQVGLKACLEADVYGVFAHADEGEAGCRGKS